MKLVPAVLLVMAAIVGESACADETRLKPCKVQSDCSATEFCNTSPRCNDGIADGVCTVKPEMCTMEYVPVKACNGESYGNRCQAFAAGQPVTGPADAVKEKE